MGLRGALARIASGASIPIHVVTGFGARDAVQELRLDPRVRFTESPRAAELLLVAGSIPDALAQAVMRLHDSLPHPRRTIFWTMDGAKVDALAARFAAPVLVGEAVLGAALDAHRALLTHPATSEGPLLPDEDPAPWRGLGPYGQGGAGMTGGTPFGRPMAELAPDRDGLRLDALPVTVGPLFSAWPAGLRAGIRFAGDVVLDEASLELVLETPEAAVWRPTLRPFLRALEGPVPIAELELARARDHLRWTAEALRVHGLGALGLRAIRMAQTVRPGDGQLVRRLTRRIERTLVLRWAAGRVGTLDPALLEGLAAGPVARAAGLMEDARLDDPAYRSLGFEPLFGTAGDAAARWRVRLAEAERSLGLAARAGQRRTTLEGRVEGPRGLLQAGDAPADRLMALAARAIEGLEWGDAVTTLVSLDLDPEEAAAARLAARPAAIAA